jgi:glycosyltransferase involved in cell wall biosynthesis
MDPRNSNQSSSPPDQTVRRLSLIVPAYNEASSIRAFHDRLAAVLEVLDLKSEIIYINDGSTDATGSLIRELQQEDARISLIELSRNFGKEAAMTAGLDHARGDAAIVIDADLQDPPELIPQLVAKWRNGYDVVYATRTTRKGESLLKKLTSHAFYMVMQRVGNVTIPIDTGDFRLLSRRAIDAIRHLREQHRFMKGLFAWIGFRQIGIPYEREPRLSGNSKWNYWSLWNFALEGISSFTTAPLRIATYLGLGTATTAFVYGLFIIWDTLVHGNPVPGYPSLMVVILFLGGVQLISIGIIGEYLGRMFDESKRRPLYLISSYIPAETASATKEDHGSQ